MAGGLGASYAFLLTRDVSEEELPRKHQGKRYLVQTYMDCEMRRAYADMWKSFHVDGYHDSIVDFDEMPARLDELEQSIESIAASRSE